MIARNDLAMQRTFQPSTRSFNENRAAHRLIPDDTSKSVVALI